MSDTQWETSGSGNRSWRRCGSKNPQALRRRQWALGITSNGVIGTWRDQLLGCRRLSGPPQPWFRGFNVAQAVVVAAIPAVAEVNGGCAAAAYILTRIFAVYVYNEFRGNVGHGPRFHLDKGSSIIGHVTEPVADASMATKWQAA